MDLSKLPAAMYIPGRQEAIDRSARIDKQHFIISLSVLFGAAMLSAIVRFVIRIFGRRKIRWDDGLVVFATVTLIVAYAVCLKLITGLYLVEAMNKKAIQFPFREEIPIIVDVVKWSTMFAAFNWTSVYMVKFAFMCFFHPLIKGLSLRIKRFFWTTVVILTVCWIYTCLSTVIVCPHFGANAGICSTKPNQHTKSLTINVLASVIDIICDCLIVSIPITVVNKSMMPFSQKFSIATMLSLSVAMIVCALIRLIGSITDTRKDGSGTAPVWAVYWAIIEGCISLIMASAIVIRGVFISNLIRDDRANKDSIFLRLGRGLVSSIRNSSRSDRSCSNCSPRGSGYESADGNGPDISAPRVSMKGIMRSTLNGISPYVSRNGSNCNMQPQNELRSVDTAYILDEMEYHKVRKQEATRPIVTSEPLHPEIPDIMSAKPSNR